MELLYQSTRSKGVKVTASQAVLKGLADDGGLFVPERIPVPGIPLEAFTLIRKRKQKIILLL